MTRYTATEADVKAERAASYADGIDMGIAHVLDALASGKTVADAIDFAKAMGMCGEAGIRGDIPLKDRREARKDVRTRHGVEAGACLPYHHGRKLA